MTQILRKAIEKDATRSSSGDRLLAAAAELGISPEAVREAQLEYEEETERRNALAAFRAEFLRSFYLHLGTYAAVNLVLILINVITWQDDHEVWAVWPILAWGIGVACHAVATFLRHDWNSGEFQRWYKRRKDAGVKFS